MLTDVNGVFGSWRWRHPTSKPIIIVSGLPRSGTSMMMNMLEAGGVELLVDGLRGADASNPRGYFEYEPVKSLDRDGDASWLLQAPGKAVKIISYLLPRLPQTHTYQMLFMNRDLSEILASQRRMLIHRSQPVDETSDPEMLAIYEEHLHKTRRLIAGRPCFTTLDVDHRSLIERPADLASVVNAFLGGHLNVERMARVPQRDLYRNRAQP